MSRGQQLSVCVKYPCRRPTRPLMHRGSMAHRHSEKLAWVYCPTIFQQGKEEVRAEADAGVANNTDLLTRENCAVP